MGLKPGEILPTIYVNRKIPGILIFEIIKPPSKGDISKLVKEVEKALSEKKGKIILKLSQDAAIGTHGYGYIEKTFRELKAIAQVYQGDIKYVLPKRLSDRAPGTVSELNDAIQALSTASQEHESLEERIKLKEKLIYQQTQIKRLTEENQLLIKKVKELMTLVHQPFTNAELIAAVEHYQRLASEVQEAPPTYREYEKESLK